MLLVISSLGHANEGLYELMYNVAYQKKLKDFEGTSSFFGLIAVMIELGITILVNGVHGFYDDIEKIHSKSVSMVIGVFTIVLLIYKT